MVSRLLNVCQINRVGHSHYDDVVAGLRRHASVSCEVPGTPERGRALTIAQS